MLMIKTRLKPFFGDAGLPAVRVVGFGFSSDTLGLDGFAFPEALGAGFVFSLTDSAGGGLGLLLAGGAAALVFAGTGAGAGAAGAAPLAAGITLMAAHLGHFN